MPEKRTHTTFLEDALDFCGTSERYKVSDALYCHLHNTGQYLAGNTQENDAEWLARSLYEEWIRHRPGPDRWDLASPEHRELFDNVARCCLKILPRLQSRIADRLIELSKVLQDIERAERAAYKAKSGE
ncbi:MAG: hypothetical protein U0790_25170 [Isosphaeraceae bacterium]